MFAAEADSFDSAVACCAAASLDVSLAALSSVEVVGRTDAKGSELAKAEAEFVLTPSFGARKSASAYSFSLGARRSLFAEIASLGAFKSPSGSTPSLGTRKLLAACAASFSALKSPEGS